MQMIRVIDYLRWRLTARKRAKASVLLKAQKYSEIKASNQQGYEICLLGDSLIEYWKIEAFGNNKCFNAGVGDATTEDVLHQLQDNLLHASFQTYVIILGTNDVKYGYTADKTADNLLHIVNDIKSHNPEAVIIYLTIPSVNGRWDRKNSALEARNKVIHNTLQEGVYILPLDFLKDRKGNLDANYTIDGLHFSEDAYKIIEDKLKKILKQ